MPMFSTGAARRLPFALLAVLMAAALLETPLMAQTLGIAAPTAGDCTTSAAGLTTCSKTNGAAFAPSATADATQGTVLYEKTFWSDLSDFTIAGTAPTISNGKVVWTAADNGNFVNSIALTGTGNNDDDIDMEVTLTLGAGSWDTGNASSNYGIGIGKLATNAINPWGAAMFYNTYNPIAQDTFYLSSGSTFTQQNVGGTNGIPVVNVGTSAAAAGEVLTLVYSQRGPRFYSYIRDATQGVRVSRNDEFPLATCATTFPNSDRMALWNNGGTYTIQSIRVVSRKRQAPNLAVVGDSKTFGCDASIRDLRFGSEIDTLGPVSVYAGSGDVTQSVLNDLPSILAAKPRAVLLNIGRNDLANGVAAATWQANYSGIVSQLKAAGVRVVHLLPIPETAQAQTALFSYITSTFPNDGLIDPAAGTYMVNGTVAYTAPSGWSNSTMLSPDAIHPTAAGHAYLASLIMASGAFPATAGAAYQPPLASSVVFPTQ